MVVIEKRDYQKVNVQGTERDRRERLKSYIGQTEAQYRVAASKNRLVEP